MKEFIFPETFIFSLDLVFGPKPIILAQIYWPVYPENGFPIVVLISIISAIVPMWLIQKVWLFLILLLSGTSAHFFCHSETKTNRYFAGILYMTNPLTYARFLSGYIGFLSGYAILPFALKYLISYFNRRKTIDIIKLVFIATIISFFSLHIIIFLGITALTLLIFEIIKYRNLNIFSEP